ncbi:MAG: hypoxanthine phosphoribosyltransferase [Deltaproteobacteria bacterium]|nr:hypoxanthine phosphoribosyltransferase [Deltaproteobacteria bacterium]
MPDLKPVLSKEEIESTVSGLAQRISHDYQDREVILIGVLKGAFVFLADLVRHLTIPVKIDFVRLASYGCKTSSGGTVCLTKEIEIDIGGKDVLVVEDITDTGLTLEFLVGHLKTLKVRSVRVCALIDKRERRKSGIAVDYAGRTVEKGFLVGYGLDYAEQYRHLPAIYDLQI